jgi:hypothetical protein
LDLKNKVVNASSVDVSISDEEKYALDKYYGVVI